MWLSEQFKTHQKTLDIQNFILEEGMWQLFNIYHKFKQTLPVMTLMHYGFGANQMASHVLLKFPLEKKRNTVKDTALLSKWINQFSPIPPSISSMGFDKYLELMFWKCQLTECSYLNINLSKFSTGQTQIRVNTENIEFPKSFWKWKYKSFTLIIRRNGTPKYLVHSLIRMKIRTRSCCPWIRSLTHDTWLLTWGVRTVRIHIQPRDKITKYKRYSRVLS